MFEVKSVRERGEVYYVIIVGTRHKLCFSELIVTGFNLCFIVKWKLMLNMY